MAGPLFVADEASALSLVELDGLTALFHRPSGITHILAPPAPQILAVIAGDPARPEEILARIERQFEVDADGNAAVAIAARLDELEAAGLVRRL